MPVRGRRGEPGGEWSGVGSRVSAAGGMRGNGCHLEGRQASGRAEWTTATAPGQGGPGFGDGGGE